MKTVYVSIGNSDDKLTQQEWSSFCSSVDLEVRNMAHVVHGCWFSATDSPRQNACWCIEIDDIMKAETELRHTLQSRAKQYRQHSIAWAEVVETEFLKAS